MPLYVGQHKRWHPLSLLFPQAITCLPLLVALPFGLRSSPHWRCFHWQTPPQCLGRPWQLSQRVQKWPHGYKVSISGRLACVGKVAPLCLSSVRCKTNAEASTSCTWLKRKAPFLSLLALQPTTRWLPIRSLLWLCNRVDQDSTFCHPQVPAPQSDHRASMFLSWSSMLKAVQ